MTNKRITELTALDGDDVADNDVLAIVDVSDTTMAASGTTKKITVAELVTDSALTNKFWPNSTTALTGANLANGDKLAVVDVGSPDVAKYITADELAQGSQFLSRYGYRGSGSPEGAVTAAVGAVYTDTAQTTGVSLWIKRSGSGNTGWAVLFGDTGWRNISTDFKTALTNASAKFVTTGAFFNIYIRRVNSEVFLTVYDNFDTDGTAFSQNVTDALPAGFGISTSAAEQYSQETVIFNRNSASVVGKVGVSTGRNLNFVMTAVAPNTGWRLQFYTSAAWPTTLPGSAA